MQKLYIKNMVCTRCIKVVREELEKTGIKYNSIQLGEVILPESISPEKLEKLNMALLENGFEIIDDSKNRLIEEIKTLVIKSIYEESKPEALKITESIVCGYY